MASPSSTTKLLQLRRLSRALKPPLPCSSIQRSYIYSSTYLPEASNSSRRPTLSPPSRGFCSRPLNLEHEGPSPIDYSSLVQEDEFHKLADSTIHDLLEKLEEYGDSVDIDGFDIDYGNQVLTVKLGTLGNYVLNKQTPNRQIWLSSPVSGPSRFDWDQDAQAWVYRRTKANLVEVLKNELEHLCGQPINLS
ncbi:frataxin, mitochondrial-like [Camellia sinensis]|uniref:frataxin, mitochondrial-like n=1 Tax=Camellia sinensis TaxID=4442 RepID=UPI00103577A0|nr:frataxin, mitochondrial-like [Camellia sinensis]